MENRLLSIPQSTSFILMCQCSKTRSFVTVSNSNVFFLFFFFLPLLVLIYLWKRNGLYAILTRDKCFIQMLLSHIVGEVMNPGAGARHEDHRVRWNWVAEAKLNLMFQPPLEKCINQGFWFAWTVRICPVPCKNKPSGEYDVSLRTK